MKIAVVTPLPTPYRDPFWNAVAAQPGVDLSVYYCSAGKRDRPWNVDWRWQFEAEVLPGRNLARIRGAAASGYWNPGITRRLRDGGYDALVVGGYNHPTMWLAMHWAWRSGIPFYLMSESHLLAKRRRWRQHLKQVPLRWIAARAAGGFPTGTLAERNLVHYGADPKSLTRLPNVPDVEALNAAAMKLRPTRSALRSASGLDDRPTTLFVGRLISKKRVSLLIRAFSRIASARQWQLVIVGDGIERQALQTLANELGVTKRVHFVGFVQPGEMCNWYAMADLFVLPSSETWGVAVLEALASGVPVIVSDEVGCHPDVVINGHLGDVVPVGDEKSLVLAMQRRLAADSYPAAERWSRAVRHSWRYDVLAKRFTCRITAAHNLTTTKAA